MEKREHDFSTRAGTIEAIKFECFQHGLVLPTQIAYILATVEHETNNTFKPIVEAYWIKRKIMRRDGAVKGKKNWQRFAKRYFRYYPFFGRGYVQLTWRHNYLKFSKILGVDMIKDPNVALRPNVALFILVYGFKYGAFSGKKIEDYINEDKTDFLGARHCINGNDKKKHIADLANKYLVVI